MERSLFLKHGSCHPRSAYFCKWSELAQRVQSVGEWKEARHTADTAVWRRFYFVGAPHCFSLRLFWAVAVLLVQHPHRPLLQAQTPASPRPIPLGCAAPPQLLRRLSPTCPTTSLTRPAEERSDA